MGERPPPFSNGLEFISWLDSLLESPNRSRTNQFPINQVPGGVDEAEKTEHQEAEKDESHDAALAINKRKRDEVEADNNLSLRPRSDDGKKVLTIFGSPIVFDDDDDPKKFETLPSSGSVMPVEMDTSARREDGGQGGQDAAILTIFGAPIVIDDDDDPKKFETLPSSGSGMPVEMDTSARSGDGGQGGKDAASLTIFGAPIVIDDDDDPKKPETLPSSGSGMPVEMDISARSGDGGQGGQDAARIEARPRQGQGVNRAGLPPRPPSRYSASERLFWWEQYGRRE